MAAAVTSAASPSTHGGRPVGRPPAAARGRPPAPTAASRTGSTLRGLPDGGSAYTATAEGGNTATRGLAVAHPVDAARHRRPSACAQAAARHDAGHEVEARDPRGERAARAGQHVARGPRLDDPALGEHHHPVGEHQRVERGVGDEHGGLLAVAHDPAQQRAHGGCGVDVERGERLVEQQEVGIGGERAGQRHPLLLAARHLRGPPPFQRRGVDGREQRPGPLLGLAPGHAVRPRPERDVGQRRHVREQQRLLGEQPDAAAVRRHVGDVGVTEPHVPLGRADAGPASTPSNVDLPAPLGPSTAITSPGVAVIVTSSVKSGAARRRARRARRGAPRSQRVTLLVEWRQGDTPATPGALTTAPPSPAAGSPRSPATATTTSTSDSATAASTSVSRSRYTSSGKVRVVPCRLPANAVVAPNSPRHRANASTVPDASPAAPAAR